MTLTKIYFRKYSRILCFIFGVLLAFLYSFVTRVDTPVIIEQQASQQVNAQKYNISEFKIISSYRLLNKVSFVFMDSKKNKYTSEDLKKDGYKMVFIDLCNVDFVKGGKHEKVTC